jgi:nitrous oxide reductase accessory protein NosL
MGLCEGIISVGPKHEREDKYRMKIKHTVIFFILVLILAGCNTTIDQEKEKTAEVVENTLSSNETAQEEAGNINFYLPFGAKIEKESPNNIIISKSSDTFILFTNPQENKDSELLYKMAISDNENLLKHGTFKEDNRLGYYVIKELPDTEEYELMVGVGGTKVTTQVELDDLADHAEMMMKIAASVKHKS